jgi:hypothetical protein
VSIAVRGAKIGKIQFILYSSEVIIMNMGCFVNPVDETHVVCVTCGILDGNVPDFFCEGSGIARMVEIDGSYLPHNGCIQLQAEHITSIQDICLLNEEHKSRRYYKKTNISNRWSKETRATQRKTRDG